MKGYMKMIAAGLTGLAIGTMAIGGFAVSKGNTMMGNTQTSVMAQSVDTVKDKTASTVDPEKQAEYRKDMIEAKKAELAVLVKNGRMTQAEADAIIKNMQEREEIAISPEKQAEYKKDMIEAKKAGLAVLVKKGRMTQAEADAIIKNMEENQRGYGMMGRGRGHMGGYFNSDGNQRGYGMMGGMGQGGYCGRGLY